jgi:hypothetical protein
MAETVMQGVLGFGLAFPLSGLAGGLGSGLAALGVVRHGDRE